MRLSSPKITSPNFFGFAQHGNFESKSTTTYLDVDEGDFAYYFFNNFILHSGHILTTKNKCKGLYLYIANEAVINGTITMNYKGYPSPPEGEYVNGYTPLGMYDVLTQNGERLTISLPGKDKLAGSTSFTNCNKWTIHHGVDGGCGCGGHGACGYEYYYASCWNGTSNSYAFSVSKANSNGGCAGVFSSGAGGGGGSPYCGYGIDAGTFGGGLAAGGDGQNYGGDGGVPYVRSTSYSGAGGQGYNVYNYGNKTDSNGNTSFTYIKMTSSLNVIGCSGVMYIIINNLREFTGLLESCGTNSPSSRIGSPPNGGAFGGGCGGGSITCCYRTKPDLVKVSANVAGIGNKTGTVHGNNLTNLMKSGNGTFRQYQIL